jgi:transglutaminase-like putative cysteine protease
MPNIRIVHTTTYRYARPVRFTPHRLMLRPRDSHDLVVSEAVLTLTPPNAIARWAHDVFSNSICTLDFQSAEADTLRIISTLQIEHFPSGLGLPEATIEPSAEIYPFRYAGEEFPDLARSLERHHPDPDRLIDAWAASFVPEDAEITYAARDAEGTNDPLVTLRTKTGACRDFALLMMEAVRSLGFAARFVSGYLYDANLEHAEDQMVGGGATHAWVSVYLPGAGWVEFDPTNGLAAGRNLIRVCTARTPEQAVPVAGGFIGALTDFIGLDVNVEVAVRGRPEKPASGDRDKPVIADLSAPDTAA